MSVRPSWSETRVRMVNAGHARVAGFAKPATGFVSNPEPRSTGHFARGRQLMAGNLMFAGHLAEAPGAMLWDISSPNDAFTQEIHGFAWLDDLAAVGDAGARAVAQSWLYGWIDAFGRGHGPGWTPELTGRRLIRWVHHALFVLRGLEADQSHSFFRVLGRQALFLGRRWKAAPPGLARFEALTGLLYAGLSLTGMEHHIAPARRALAEECRRQIDASGGLPTRNPEELLEVFTLLTWAAAGLEDSGHDAPDELRGAIQRIAPTLRTLRHADGGLARFHGGGRGLDGRLDQALAASGVKRRQVDGLAMGFVRLSAGRTSVIVDAGPPPTGRVSHNAHASTLAMELTSGRRPVVVNCGSGASFGEDWRRAGRATPSHSALALDGYSSARLGAPGVIGGARLEALEDVPGHVPVQISTAPDGSRFEGGHDGYVATHGLTHARILELTLDGRGLVGEDLLLVMEDADKRIFDRALDATGLAGVEWQARFHLHPDVDAEIDMGGSAVSLALRSGEVWVFRHDGPCDMTLEPSVYLEKGRLKPRASKQVVLSGRAVEYATRIRWSLAKAQETGNGIRDLYREEIELTA